MNSINNRATNVNKSKDILKRFQCEKAHRLCIAIINDKMVFFSKILDEQHCIINCYDDHKMLATE